MSGIGRTEDVQTGGRSDLTDGDRNVKGQCRMWNVLSHAQIGLHVHDDTQTLANSYCAPQ